MSRKNQRIAATALALGLVGGGSLLTAGGASATEIDDAATPMGACEAGWYYSAQSLGADQFTPTGNVMSSYNGGAGPASHTFTADVSGTVETTVSGELNVGVDAAVADINATFGIAASTSRTTSLGQAIAIEVPVGMTGNGQYGAWKANVAGVSQYRTPACDVTQTVSSTIDTPYRDGFNTWIS